MPAPISGFTLWVLCGERRGLVAAAAASAATSAAAQGRQGAGAEGRLVFSGAAYPGEHRDGPLGWLLTIGTVGAAGTHRLELFKFVATGGAMIFVQGHNIPL